MQNNARLVNEINLVRDLESQKNKQDLKQVAIRTKDGYRAIVTRHSDVSLKMRLKNFK
jgi:hypothetical protein